MNSLELKVPPLILLLLDAFCMKSLAAGSRYIDYPFPWRGPFAVTLVVTGIVVVLAGVVAFRLASTTVDPTRPGKASTVVTGGIYRLTRNPMYLGFVLMLAGWAVWLSNPLAWLGPAVFVWWMNRFQIGPEEQHLHEKFGEPYAAYLNRVRRWI